MLGTMCSPEPSHVATYLFLKSHQRQQHRCPFSGSAPPNGTGPQRLAREEPPEKPTATSDEAHLQWPGATLVTRPHSYPSFSWRKTVRKRSKWHFPTSEYPMLYTSIHRNSLILPHQGEVCSISVSTENLQEAKGKPF